MLDFRWSWIKRKYCKQVGANIIYNHLAFSIWIFSKSKLSTQETLKTNFNGSPVKNSNKFVISFDMYKPYSFGELLA